MIAPRSGRPDCRKSTWTAERSCAISAAAFAFHLRKSVYFGPMSHSTCDSRGIFVQKTLVHVVRHTFRTAAQAFGTFGFPIDRVAFDLVSLTFGTCCGVSTKRGCERRTTAYRLGSSACAAGGWDASHPHDLRPHSVAFVATSRGHQAFQYSIKTDVTDRQGIGTQRRCRWSRRPRCHVTVKDSATIHQLEIATAGASAFCLDPGRVVDAGVDS